MVTAEELRERPVLLELRLGGNEDKLQWLVRDELNYSKLEKMSAKEAVEYMRHEYSITQANPETIALAHEIDEFIKQAGKGYYDISTETSDVMTCAVSFDGKKVSVIKDQRDQSILDHLTPVTTEDKIDIWYQGLTIREPTNVCG